MTVWPCILRDHAVGIHVSHAPETMEFGSNGRINLSVHLRIRVFDTVLALFGTVLALFGHCLALFGHCFDLRDLDIDLRDLDIDLRDLDI